MADIEMNFSANGNSTQNNKIEVNSPSKQIIVTFSDGYCIVLENNEVSIRENDFTKYRIVVGDRTNELLEFVKDTYLQLKAKEQECEKAKQVVLQAVEDFNLEYGTPYYDRLLDGAKSLGIEVKDYE